MRVIYNNSVIGLIFWFFSSSIFYLGHRSLLSIYIGDFNKNFSLGEIFHLRGYCINQRKKHFLNFFENSIEFSKFKKTVFKAGVSREGVLFILKI